MSSAKDAMDVEIEGASTAESSKASMETTSGSEVSKNVMAPGAVGSITCSLHPLVIMNISEHWTRERAQEGSVQQVIGAIIGKQKGRNIEVMNSFELVFSVIGSDVVIDKDYYNMKEEQCELYEKSQPRKSVMSALNINKVVPRITAIYG